MLTPCLLIPWSTAAYFIFLTFSQGCICFLNSLPQQIFSSRPLKFLYFPLPLLSDQMLINSWHAVRGGDSGGGPARALQNTAWIKEWVTVFLLKQLSPSKVQMDPLVPYAVITVWNSLSSNKCCFLPCCMCTALQSLAEQLNSSMCPFFFSWQKSPCLLISYKL